VTSVRRDTVTVKVLGKRSALIEHESAGQAVAGVAVMFDRLDVAVGVRVVQRPVLAETFDVVRTLHVMHERFDGVASGKEISESIKVDALGIAAAFGEQLELFRTRVVTPDTLLKSDASNAGRRRAALSSVQPAVWSPG
jgi:hypothetical protein